MNLSVIIFIIGLLTGLLISVFTGIITLSKGIALSISALIGGAFGPVLSTIISNEFNRWRNKKEEIEKDVNMRFKKHTIEQIIPLFEELSNIKLLPINQWKDLTFNFVLYDKDFISTKEYHDESIEHLKSYNNILSRWEELNSLVDGFNRSGNKVIDLCIQKVASLVFDKIPDFIKYDEQVNLISNSYKPLPLTKRVVFHRLYENIRHKTIEYAYYQGENKSFDDENYSLIWGGEEVARGEKEKISLLSDICSSIGRDFESIFENEIKRVIELQGSIINIEEKYEQYQKEFKIEISRIKAGDTLLGKCIICRNWLTD